MNYLGRQLGRQMADIVQALCHQHRWTDKEGSAKKRETDNLWMQRKVGKETHCKRNTQSGGKKIRIIEKCLRNQIQDHAKKRESK